MKSHYTPPSARPAIEANVIFGTLSKNCRGVGICKVEVKRGPGEVRADGCPHSAAVFLEKMSEGELRFSFRKKELSPRLLGRFFRHGEFPVPEDYTFEKPLLQMLELNEFTIRAGIYTVQESEEWLKVDFRPAHRPTPSSERSFVKRRKRLHRQLLRARLL